MALITPRVWTTQPINGALNTNHPLCPDYRVWYPPTLRELITANSPAAISARRSIKNAGIGLTYTASTSDTPSQQFYPSEISDFSALVIFATTEPSTSQAFCYQSNGSGTTNYNGFGAGGTNLLEIHFGVDNTVVANNNRLIFACQRGTGQLIAPNNIVLQTGQPTIAVAVVKGADAVLYVNGSKGTITTGTANLALTPSFYRFAETGATSAGRYFRGTIYAFYCWRRALSDGEVQRISANPYQIFRSQELQLGPAYPRIYYVAGPNATWATPTSTEIMNGQLSGGGAATASWSESAPLQSTNPFNFSQPASPLTTGTKYRAAAVQKAGDSNVVSNVVESDPFLAGAATLSNPEATEITGTSTKPKVTVSY